MRLLLLLILLAVTGTISAQVAAQSAASAKDLSFADSPLQPDLTPGYVLVEGDIQIPMARYDEMVNPGPHTMATYGGVNYWPGNVVPYDFVTGTGTAADVSVANQSAATNAMTNIAARVGVIFRLAVSSDANRIRFQNSSFNNSPVGMQSGTQIINIASWGLQITICHEIYHSLGFWHEQSRLDRDTFITVNNNNICGTASSGACAPANCCLCQDSAANCISCLFNFTKQPGTSTYGAYDFDSFMHYGRNAFSCTGSDTITVNPTWNAQWQNSIGQRNHFSYWDAITCRALYPFPGDRWLDRAYTDTSDGTFEKPYKSATLVGALAAVPSGGTLLIKYGNTYSAVGTYQTPVTIMAPNGAVTLSK
jgi:hypothetical protein